MKQHIYIIALPFFYLFFSCSVVNQSVVKKNEFFDNYMHDFSNDSLRLKMAFYGNTIFGDKHLTLGNVRRAFKKIGTTFPKRNIVLWGTYHSTTHPMYLVGSLQNNVDITTYQIDTSIHHSTYYYKVWHNGHGMLSEVAIPYDGKKFLCIKELRIGARDDDKTIKDVRHGVKTTFGSLAYGKHYVKPEKIDYFDRAESALKDQGYADYLQAKETLENLIMIHGDNVFANELLKSYRSFLGEAVNYDDYPDLDIDGLTKIPVSASDLVERVKDHQVVMFNENHLSPRCRLLINLMLPQLYNEGFRVLALEGLSEEDEGYPNIESGFYTREPNMANLIRTAKKIGYNIIGYEDFEDNNERDLAQAENLINKSGITKDNNVKVVLLGGGGHIDESDREDNRSMAKYFKDITGIDPFTINQVKFLTHFVANDSIYIVNNPDDEGYDLYLSNSLISNRIVVGEDVGYKTHRFLINKTGDDNQSAIYIYDHAEYQSDKTAIPLYVAYRTTADITIDFPKGKYIFIHRASGGAIIQEEIVEI